MPAQPHPPAGAPRLRLLVWVAALCVTLPILTALGRGALAMPSILDPASWAPWAAERDAAVIVFALLRAATVVLAWYLLGVTLLGVLSWSVRSARMVAFAGVVTVPALRRLLQPALGVGLVTALTACSSGGSSVAPPPVPAAVLAGEPSGEVPPAAPDAVVVPPEPPEPPVPPAPQVPPVPPVPHVSRTRAQPPPAAPERDRWMVRPGDHFWSIAEAVLRERQGAPSSDDDVAEYWERLVAGNRTRLVDSSNPDLLYPGQTLHLPRIR